MGVSARAVGDGDGFTAPDKFRAALPEALPAADGVFSWLAVGSSVPAFHGLDGDAVNDFDVTPLQRLKKRRAIRRCDFAVARNCETESAKVLLKLLHRFETTEAEDGRWSQAEILC